MNELPPDPAEWVGLRVTLARRDSPPVTGVVHAVHGTAGVPVTVALAETIRGPGDPVVIVPWAAVSAAVLADVDDGTGNAG